MTSLYFAEFSFLPPGDAVVGCRYRFLRHTTPLAAAGICEGIDIGLHSNEDPLLRITEANKTGGLRL